MSNKNILELPDEKLKEIFLTKHTVSKKVNPTGEKSLIAEEIVDQALGYYKDKFITPFQSLSITPSEDYKYLQSKAKSIIEDAIMQSFRNYPEHKENIIGLYQETKDWDKVITEIFYQGEIEEPLIDYIEEIYKVKIKNLSHLQKLTGISEDTLNIIKRERDIITQVNFQKYLRTLSVILNNGGTYSDLLKVEPKEYGLPETWEGELGKNKASTISWAIAFHYNLGEVALNLLPNFRYYAEDLKAPLSVIMDAYFTINGIKK